jgi:FKBP-type peptidyl-prolyl cis-trans isomerase
MKRLILVGVVLIAGLVFLQVQLNKMPQPGSFDEERDANAAAAKAAAFGGNLKSSPISWDVAKNAKGPMITSKSGLQYFDIKVGTGKSPSGFDVVAVNYAGFLQNGKTFDESYKQQDHKAAVMNIAGTVPGFKEGLVGMKIGGRRKLIIPPQLGYGNRGMGNIPPNSTLIFVVDLLDIQHQTKGE